MNQWARTPSGDMLLPTRTGGQAAIVKDPVKCAAIKIPSVLQTIQGEWFLDTQVGFPWFPIWRTKAPNLTTLRHLFRKTVAAIDNVASVEDVQFAYDSELRDLKYNLRAKLVDGGLVSVP